jgi:hypothetical protein
VSIPTDAKYPMNNREIMVALRSVWGSREHKPLESQGILQIIEEALANAQNEDPISKQDAECMLLHLQSQKDQITDGAIPEKRSSTYSQVFRIFAPALGAGLITSVGLGVVSSLDQEFAVMAGSMVALFVGIATIGGREKKIKSSTKGFQIAKYNSLEAILHEIIERGE